jgi:ELWxxDGT repeat protein
MVADICPGDCGSSPTYLAVFGDALYFTAFGTTTHGSELWKYDGVTVTMAVDINPGSGSSVPRYLAVFSDTLYFPPRMALTGTSCSNTMALPRR